MLPAPWRGANPREYPSDSMSYSDPVHVKQDGWYFWDETWCDEHGPFSTIEECREALTAYAEVNGLT